MAYTVWNTSTGKMVCQTNSSVEAYRRADAMDEAYGAVCTRVERDYDVMSDEEFEAMMVRVRAEKVAA